MQRYQRVSLLFPGALSSRGKLRESKQLTMDPTGVLVELQRRCVMFGTFVRICAGESGEVSAIPHSKDPERMGFPRTQL